MLNWWYNLTDILLPFDWLSHVFMKNALLAILLASLLFAIIGTMVVNNKMAFFSDSIGHGAFTGIAIGAIFGLTNPVWSAIIFSVLFAIIITVIKSKSKTSPDTIIGVFSSTAVALGLVILSFGGSFNKFSSYLIGDLLSITPTEIYLLIVIFVAVIALWIIIFNKILVISVNTSLAHSRGINTLLCEILFTCTIAVVVTVTISWVGLLIINSLLVLPAAAARNVSTNVRQYHFFSVVISLISGIAGLILSYYFNTATGATIVLVSAVLFFVALLFKRN